MLEVKCLKIRFKELTVLNGIDIVVEKGWRKVGWQSAAGPHKTKGE